VVGSVVAVLVLRAVRSEMNGVSERTVAPVAVAVMVIAAMSLLASALPARTAAKADPNSTLRAE
jgi:ABC-type antimicrobial peptide transport system permease subunit